jgi:hypothetical protein
LVEKFKIKYDGNSNDKLNKMITEIAIAQKKLTNVRKILIRMQRIKVLVNTNMVGRFIQEE